MHTQFYCKMATWEIQTQIEGDYKTDVRGKFESMQTELHCEHGDEHMDCTK